jgi:hypothetical protein
MVLVTDGGDRRGPVRRWAVVAVIDRGVDEGADERRWGANGRFELRLKERRDEKRMARQLDDPSVAVIIFADDMQPGTLDGIAVSRIQSIVAMISLYNAPTTVNGGGATGGIEKDRRCLGGE